MEEMLSPNFTHKKLESPSNSDLIDVFEDLWNGYIFMPVRLLLDSPHGSISAMLVLCSYYEVIESLYTAQSSKNNSQTFFLKGFSRVFSNDTGDTTVAAKEIYLHVRCGLAHEGMLRSKVHHSNIGNKAFFLTYPKLSDGTLDTRGPSVSIVVNPERMYNATLQHFLAYVQSLRNGNDASQFDNFKSFVMSQYNFGGGESIIGMTFEEFNGNA